ncbi:MAG: circadian clock KaiB family protein [Oligoflexales bacterium]|nr:circadian clock KaiB family protein [Oligoflexales bacterium]
MKDENSGLMDKEEDVKISLEEKGNEKFVLKLFVTGLTPRSIESISSIRAICEEELKGRYHLEVIDLSKEPEKAKDANIIAAPTLLRQIPLPLRRLIGDLTNRSRVIEGLGIIINHDNNS